MIHLLLDAFFAKPLSISDEEWESIPIRMKVEHVPELHARGLTSLDTLVSACAYHESQLLQRAIHAFKYKRISSVTDKLAECIRVTGEWEMTPDMVIVPVPLHWRRTCDRGFNQASVLAKCVSRDLHMPYADILRRVRDTGHQAHRKRIDRIRAMTDAFLIRNNVRAPEHVVLIDDIVTTGATLDACATACKRAGAKRVDAWVIARA